MSKGAILVVDDNPVVREALCDALEAEDLQVWAAETGTTALADPPRSAARRPQKQSRRIVLRRTRPAAPSRTRGRAFLLAIVVGAIAVWVIVWLSRQP